MSFDKKGLVKVDNKIIKKEAKELELGKNLDDATMEGIKRSLKYLKSKGHTDYVVIYSDRKTVIDCINNQGKYYTEIEELIEKFNNVEFIWIPRSFNGWADKLARKEREKITNMPIELFEEILNYLPDVKEMNNLYLDISKKLEREERDNNNLKKKIENLENTVIQYRSNNKELKSKNKKLEVNKNTYIRIIEKQNKEIQKYNSLYNENESNKYIARQQSEKLNTLREINRELHDDLQYYKRKVEELIKENDDLVKKMHEKYTEEFCEEFEMVGSSKKL